MNYDVFWRWVGGSGDSVLRTPNVDSLNIAFCSLGDSEQLEIAKIVPQLLASTDRLELWELCSLLSGQPCGDDSFSYFRRWLILQGKHVFTEVLANPDNLASFVEGSSPPREPFVESLGLAEDGGGTSLWQDAANHAKDIRAWSWLESSKDRIRSDLPRIWSLVGKDFQWDAQSEGEAHVVCHAPGIGMIRVGDRLAHSAGLGVGVVTAVLVAETAVVEIEFSAGKRPFRVTNAFFKKVD